MGLRESIEAILDVSWAKAVGVICRSQSGFAGD
jgi:hypothetical protein